MKYEVFVMKRKEKLSLRKDLLSKYYEIDNKTAKVKLYYDTFSELINQNFGDEKVELINTSLFEDIQNAIEYLPLSYNIDIDIFIKDFGSYSIEESSRIIKENILMKGYNFGVERYRTIKKGLALALSGVVLLVASYFCSSMEWPSIIYDIINITGTLFIWDACEEILIENNGKKRELRRYVKKVKNITLHKMD